MDKLRTSIAINPTTAILKAGARQQFTATARDQFGLLLATAPTFTWSTTAGTISADGWLTAPDASVNNATVTATSGSGCGTASFTVNGKPLISSVVITASNGTMTWNVYDPDGVKSVRLTVGGRIITKVYGPYKDSQGVKYAANFGLLASGSHAYTIIAADKAGRISTLSGGFTVVNPGPAISAVAVTTSTGTMRWNAYDVNGIENAACGSTERK